MTPNLLLQFLNRNGNILLTLSADAPTPASISSLLLELDIHLPPDRNSLVIDHFNYDTISSPEQHDVLLLPRPSPIRPGVKNFFGGGGMVAFPRAVAQELGNNSPLLAPILRAKSSAYSYNPKDEDETVDDPFAVGEQIALVSSMQARNSARFTVFGSAEALENKWFDVKFKPVGGKDSKSVNQEFAKQVTAWTFQELGVLKVGRVGHHLSSISEGSAGNSSVTQLGYSNPSIYRVKNDVVSTMSMLIIINAKFKNRPSTSNFPNILMIILFRLHLIPRMLSNLNSPCSPHSTALTLSQSPKLQTAQFSAKHSNYRTSTESFLFESITNDHF